MSKKLALLSGKGGSGKTTLALSMASLLSNCEINVLLIDCDLSTNGATYFYEDKLSEYEKGLLSFDKILNKGIIEKIECIKINKYFDFIPSITQITKESMETYIYNEIDKELFSEFLEIYANKYDIVLFDCQAGYTDILKVILPYVDECLIVMEADAISSAALRSLYLKIGEILREKKVFQIFNKVTNEEYNIYSKISGGTVFTNIETVMFDWKIRKAFSIARIPDMENTSANYGKQIYSICNILFPREYIQKKLIKFKLILEKNEIIEQKVKIENKIAQLKDEKNNIKNKINKFVHLFLPLVVGVITIVSFILTLEKEMYIYIYNDVKGVVFVGLLASMVLMMWILVYEQAKQQKAGSKELVGYMKMLEEMTIKQKEIDTLLENNEEIGQN